MRAPLPNPAGITVNERAACSNVLCLARHDADPPGERTTASLYARINHRHTIEEWAEKYGRRSALQYGITTQTQMHVNDSANC